ncbi:MAG: hypothetical protein AAGJ35_06140, partial [Myxococcota bacterium]
MAQLNVLILDPVNRHGSELESMLNQLGARVFCTAHQQEATNYLQIFSPDVFLGAQREGELFYQVSVLEQGLNITFCALIVESLSVKLRAQDLLLSPQLSSKQMLQLILKALNPPSSARASVPPLAPSPKVPPTASPAQQRVPPIASSAQQRVSASTPAQQRVPSHAIETTREPWKGSLLHVDITFVFVNTFLR